MDASSASINLHRRPGGKLFHVKATIWSILYARNRILPLDYCGKRTKYCQCTRGILFPDPHPTISNEAGRLIVRRQGPRNPAQSLYTLLIYRSAHRRAHPSGHDAALRSLGGCDADNSASHTQADRVICSYYCTIPFRLIPGAAILPGCIGLPTSS